MEFAFLSSYSTIADSISMVTQPADTINTTNRSPIMFGLASSTSSLDHTDRMHEHGRNFLCANMSVFEKLGPFVSLCQACGMIPYTVKGNSDTNQFEKFTFSFKHFNTWWFFLILVLQLSLFGATPLFYRGLFQELAADRTVPITFTILTGTVSFSYFAQFLTCRWIILRHRRLRAAVEAVQEVERLFGEQFIAQHQSSIVARTVIGFTLAVTASTVALCVMIPTFQSFLPKDLGIFSATALFSIITSINIMFECNFLLIHLSYYIIAHYINLLSLQSDVEDGELPVTFSKRSEKNLERNALIFDHLCQASSQLNGILSVPVLFLLTTKFLSIVTSAYSCIFSLIHANEVLNDFSFVFPFLFFTDWIRLLILLSAADMPVHQVRLLRERLTSVTYTQFAQPLADKIEMIITLLQINEDRVRLSAAGLFKVGVHLIPSLTGAVVTYMVILLQN